MEKEKTDTGCSDVELIMDMMNDDSSFVLHDEVVESNKGEAYYEAKAFCRWYGCRPCMDWYI